MYTLWVFMTLPVFIHGLTPGAINSYISVPGKVLPGPLPPGSIKLLRDVTLTECAADCSLEYSMNTFHCYAFQYARANKMCILTNVTSLVLKGGFLGLQRNAAMTYYERSKGSYVNLFQPFPQHVLQEQTTYFTMFNHKSLEQCAAFCLMESRDTCMSFSYSASKQVCGLSNVFYAKDNHQDLMTSTDYDHYQYFTTWPCNATIPWNYTPRAIASPYFPYASLEDVSCYVIIEAPEGQQVDLVFSTLYAQHNICQNSMDGLAVYDGAAVTAPLLAKLCSTPDFANRRFQSSNGNLYVQFATGAVPIAFKGVYDFLTIDPCAQTPCQNGGTCLPQSGNFSCACVPGYTGYLCQTDINECATNPCNLGGRCIDLVHDFRCDCPDMLGGRLCTEFVGLCYTNPCKNGGHCSPRGADKYICACPNHFRGVNCTIPYNSPCTSNPCMYGGNCTTIGRTDDYSCACVAGYSGRRCEININECASNPCLHGISCTDLVNGFSCDCPSFMSGNRCETFIGKCSENPCRHGICSPTGRESYSCTCDTGYVGKNCEIAFIDYCQPNPCHHGKCTSYENGPSCTCDFGYEGFFCDNKVNHCDGVQCNHGECIRLEAGFRCDCVTGYEGRFCNNTVNHCLSANCHGGFCINTLSSHFCVCKGGHTGPDCDVPTTTPPTCGIDSCVNGTCADHANGFICECYAGFTGTICDTTIDYCLNAPCHHGQCESITGNYRCTCEENYTGNDCDKEIDPCKNNKCVFGFCLVNNDGYACVCGSGYHGRFCEFRQNESDGTTLSSSAATQFHHAIYSTSLQTTPRYCSSATCKHGVCDVEFSNECVCLLGYTGPMCDRFAGCDIHDPCLHGNCTEHLHGYVCTCEHEYTGTRCESKSLAALGACANISICQNGGFCLTGSGPNHSASYTCLCLPGYMGDHCEVIDACNGQPCKTGTCVNIGFGFRCRMPPLVSYTNTSWVGLPGAVFCLSGVYTHDPRTPHTTPTVL